MRPTDLESSGVIGYWRRDDSHFPRSMSAQLWDLFVPAYRKGTAEGFERCGSVISHFDLRREQGAIYSRRCLRTEPDAIPGDTEALREAARRVFESRIWNQDRGRWTREQNAMRERLLNIGSLDLAVMDQDSLRQHVETLRRMFVDGLTGHFVRQPVSMIPVGDWLRRAHDWTATPIPTLVGMLRGASPGSVRCREAVGNIIDAVGHHEHARAILENPALPGAARLDALSGLSPEAGRRVREYLGEYGDRVIAGFDLTDLTLRETPGAIVSIIAARLTRVRDPDPEPDSAELERVRSAVPADCRTTFDEGLAEARSAYGLHDEDLGVSYLWPLGLLRRATLELAGRAVIDGRLEHAPDVFHLTIDELDALLDGSGPAKSEITRRGTVLTGADGVVRPTLGVPPAPPHDLDSASARVHDAITCYLEHMEHSVAPGVPAVRNRIDGIGASPGVYEGRGRIVRTGAELDNLMQGDILIAETLSPAYSVFLPLVGAVVTDRGGVLCHAAIVARELGVPAVVGTQSATVQIPDGALLRVDGARGWVEVQ